MNEANTSTDNKFFIQRLKSISGFALCFKSHSTALKRKLYEEIKQKVSR